MANYFYDSNLEITKYNIAKDGELKDLEINKQNIELGGEVNKEDKEVTITTNTTTTIEPSAGYDALGSVEVTTDIPLEEKAVTVVSNGETTIEPSSDYEGISSVALTVSVPVTGPTKLWSWKNSSGVVLVTTVQPTAADVGKTIYSIGIDDDYHFVSRGGHTIGAVTATSMTLPSFGSPLFNLIEGAGASPNPIDLPSSVIV